jgi:amidase
MLIESYASAGTGMTVAVKDCIDIAGRPTCCGSRAFADSPPAGRNAAVVQALIDGGCGIVAKAAMHELAYGVTGVNGWTGTVENPNFPGLIAGGSSSGSAAAVAAGAVDVALGTDTGGSVRMPAACCGVMGLKPSFGRLSRDGVLPAATTLDCVGLFATSVDRIEAAMRLMDDGFVPEAAPNTFTLGRVSAEADPEVDGAIDEAIVACGCRVVRAPLPLLEAAFQAGVVIMAGEASAAYGHLVGSGLLGADIEARLAAAPALATPRSLREAEAVRIAFTTAVDDALERCEALVLPTLPAFPPRLDDLGDGAALLRLTALVRPFNLSGHPAISLPVATPSGRPAALQLIARRGDDARLCAIARRFRPT